uniref:Uncharacterized protein n=1 Tax=Parascaris equorum TaxID=6256 RepID=A0A914S6L2_PAREQ
MGVRAFSPLSYFPQVDRVNRLVESACRSYLNAVDEDPTLIPEMDIKHCDIKQVTNVLANAYFTEYILPKVEYFEDFIEVLDGIRANHITALYREAERFICR